VFSRGFGDLSTAWPTNFQDRLVVTASIFLHIIMHDVALWYAVLFRSGSWNSFHESASHPPRRRVKLTCKRQGWVSSTESKYSYHNAILCYYSVLSFVRYCFRLRVFGDFRTHEKMAFLKLRRRDRLNKLSFECFFKHYFKQVMNNLPCRRIKYTIASLKPLIYDTIFLPPCQYEFLIFSKKS